MRSLQFLDQEDLFRGLNFSQVLNTTEIKPSTSTIYNGCERGESLFQNMHIDRLFDLEDLLNSTKYLKEFRNTVQNMSINLDGLKLMSVNGRQALLKFRKMGLEGIKYDEMLLLLSRPVVKRDLDALANELDEKAEIPANEMIKKDLKNEASNARQLDSIVKQQMTDAGLMSKSVNALRNISKSYMGNVDKTLESFSITQNAMYAKVPLIVSNVSMCTLEKAQEHLLRYMNWARQAILNEVLGCRWLALSLDNVYTAVCVNVLDPWNAFWLCVGWFCAFLVPGVILSLCVARRLKPTPPSCIGKNSFSMPEKSLESSKSNIYVTLKEIRDMSISDCNLVGKKM